MASTFVSKSRKVKFGMTFTIFDLNNVPLVNGSSYVSWHLPNSTAAEHRGRTNKCAIREHRVQYDYEKQTTVRLTVSKDGMLQECLIHFEVMQEYPSGGRNERIKLGEIHLNLAEYADAALDLPASPGGGANVDAEDYTIIRRYLMQESKINSTLKIGIRMQHIEGTRDYYAPPLRTAPVFGGIAGIISSSEPASTIRGVGSHVNPDVPTEGQEPIPQNFSINNKEMGEMQDMYRRTLAAFWNSQPGELRADECIENIFAGGDGWGKDGRPKTSQNSQPGSGDSTPNIEGVSREGSTASKPSEDRDGMRSMIQGHKHKFSAGHHHHHRNKSLRKMPGELDEMDVREDLVSWSVGENAYS